MTLKKIISAAALAVLCAPATHAEVRGAYGNWLFGISGTAVEGGKTYDFERDLAARRAGNNSLQLAWDTGPGWWRPDLELNLSRIGVQGSNTGLRCTQVVPVGPPSCVTTTLTVDSNFHDEELVARYPLNSGALKLSAGLAVKHLRGTVVITDSSQSQPSRGDYNQTFPELHADLRWPVTSWAVLELVGQGAQYQGSRAFEWRAGFEVQALAPLLIEASWQQKRYDINVNRDALNVSLDGALLRAGFLLR